jgi:hypothetical protein
VAITSYFKMVNLEANHFIKLVGKKEEETLDGIYAKAVVEIL